MNWLLIIIALILAGNIIWGFSKGFLRVIYTMLAGIVIMIFVIWVTPFVADTLTKNTDIDNRIEAGCTEKLHDIVKQDEQQEYSELQMKLPDAVKRRLFDTSQITDHLLEDSGIYQTVAGRATDMAMRVIAFVLVLLITLIAFHLISVVLKVVEKLPVIGGVNRLLGLFAGLVKGFIIVWLIFAVIAMGSATQIGAALVVYIYDSSLLTWLYENNLILTLLLTFL